MIARIAAIVRADVLIRFRRPSTAVVFLLLSAFAYIWVPAPETGRALMRVAGARVVNNSAAVSLGTGMLAALFIGLIGFYVVSNAIGRDLRTRCGSVLAATGMRSGEYIVGKFAGNVVFLLTFCAGFMIVAMAMVVVRGEGPLEVLTFLAHYALLVPPTISIVSALAIVFESIPALSGRGGDVLYFFVWMMLMSFAAALMANDVRGAEYLDFQGFAFVLAVLREKLGTTGFAIGSGPFDPKLPVVVLSRFNIDLATFAPRIIGTVWPVSLLLIARLAFHRFDPVRVKSGGRNLTDGWMARINRLLKPLTRVVALVPMRGPLGTDALTTFTSHPIAVVALVALMIAAAVAPQSLPIAFAAAAMFIADVATRDRSAGTTALIYATPRLRERFVLWKFSSSLLVASLLLAVPVVRAALSRPSALLSLAIGTLFIAAAATAFGIISASPKTFIVLFLSFWYLVVNDRGATPTLDFAGLYGAQPIHVTLTYLTLSVVLLIAAQLTHSVRLRA